MASQAYKKDTDVMEKLWASVGEAMYSLTPRETQLGLGEEGITTYFSSNCTLADASIAKQFLTEKVGSLHALKKIVLKHSTILWSRSVTRKLILHVVAVGVI